MNLRELLPGHDQSWSFLKTLAAGFLSFVMVALLLITSMAWQAAFQHWLDSTPGLKKYGMWPYACIVTLVAIVIIMLISYLMSREQMPAGQVGNVNVLSLI